MMYGNRDRRSAWTLKEMLVVLALIGVMAGLVTTSIHSLWESANRLQCQSHMKELALAVHSFHTDRGRMPPYATGKFGEMFGGWFAHLLPYVGYANLQERLHTGQQSTVGELQAVSTGIFMPGVADAAFPTLACPSDPSRESDADAKTNYLANWYAFSNGTSTLYPPQQQFANLTDGLSNVVLFAEGYSTCDGLPRLALFTSYYHNFGVTQHGMPSDDPFYAPNDYTMFQLSPDKCDKWRTQSAHSAMNVALADGSVRPLASDITADTWKQLLKPRDGLPANGDW